MSEHISSERMNEMLDGLISSVGAERARRHLAECAACRELYARLSEIVTDLRALPRDAKPPEALWASIGQRITSTVADVEPVSADVLAFPGSGPRRRVFTFTATQLAAASVVLCLLSTTAVWMVSRPTRTEELTTVAPTINAGRAARFATDESAYDTALDELLAFVDEARPYLAPATLLALDASLATIDAAIEEIQVALESDPSSELLRGMLVNQQRSKLRVLRQVATRAQAQS